MADLRGVVLLLYRLAGSDRLSFVGTVREVSPRAARKRIVVALGHLIIAEREAGYYGLNQGSRWRRARDQVLHALDQITDVLEILEELMKADARSHPARKSPSPSVPTVTPPVPNAESPPAPPI